MGVLSKTCEYAIRAACYISQKSQEGQNVGVKEIADQIGSPESFLSKILQKMVKGGVIQSVKGPHGGFYISHDGLSRPIADIVDMFEGEELLGGCGVGLNHCSDEKPCPIHPEFVKVRSQLAELLRSTPIGTVGAELLDGKFFLSS